MSYYTEPATCHECSALITSGLVGLIEHVQRRHHVELPNAKRRRQNERRQLERMNAHG